MASARSSVVVTVTVWPLALDKPASRALRRMEFRLSFGRLHCDDGGKLRVCHAARQCADHKAPHTNDDGWCRVMVFPSKWLLVACCAAVRRGHAEHGGFC